MIRIKKRRLKTHWLIIFTVLLTLSAQFVIKVMRNRVQTIIQVAETCDVQQGYTCSTYQLRQS